MSHPGYLHGPLQMFGPGGWGSRATQDLRSYGVGGVTANSLYGNKLQQMLPAFIKNAAKICVIIVKGNSHIREAEIFLLSSRNKIIIIILINNYVILRNYQLKNFQLCITNLKFLKLTS